MSTFRKTLKVSARRALFLALSLSLVLALPVFASASASVSAPVPWSEMAGAKPTRIEEAHMPDSYKVADGDGLDTVFQAVASPALSSTGIGWTGFGSKTLNLGNNVPAGTKALVFYYDLSESTFGVRKDGVQTTGMGAIVPDFTLTIGSDGNNAVLEGRQKQWVRTLPSFETIPIGDLGITTASGGVNVSAPSAWSGGLAGRTSYCPQSSGYMVVNISESDLNTWLSAEPNKTAVPFSLTNAEPAFGGDLIGTAGMIRDIGFLTGDTYESAVAELELAYKQNLNYVMTNSFIYHKAHYDQVSEPIPNSSSPWYACQYTYINDPSRGTVPEEAEAVVFYYDTTKMDIEYVTALDLLISKGGINDYSNPLYNQTVGGAYCYGLSVDPEDPTVLRRVDAGTLGSTDGDSVVGRGSIPGRSYGYKIIPKELFVEGATLAGNTDFFRFAWVFDTNSGTMSALDMEFGAVGYVLDLDEFKSQLDEDLAASEARVQDAIAKIAAIGTVTSSSGPDIAAAREAYDALDAGRIISTTLPYGGTPEKSLVGSAALQTLVDAEENFREVEVYISSGMMFKDIEDMLLGKKEHDLIADYKEDGVIDILDLLELKQYMINVEP